VQLYTPEQRSLLDVRPGITSHASLHYREEEQLLAGEDWETTYINRILPHKLSIELGYLDQRSIWSDLGIVFQTVFPFFRPAQLPAKRVSAQSAPSNSSEMHRGN
jgi:lipopolysaccharide/colanic/teichoic acid biosynthesis glycosyltransferase